VTSRTRRARKEGKKGLSAPGSWGAGVRLRVSAFGRGRHRAAGWGSCGHPAARGRRIGRSAARSPRPCRTLAGVSLAPRHPFPLSRARRVAFAGCVDPHIGRAGGPRPRTPAHPGSGRPPGPCGQEPCVGGAGFPLGDWWRSVAMASGVLAFRATFLA
jgi:hypothetical protein